ncbi:uncharacterized protein EAF01_007848 [Botrytis porri]|uniref:uncharacterized protein n=1 Tax=Botrytis porri TaxID=87229 RepID=UPI001901E0A8|nr:uncharacterized protein EAF01_007848 [Botrytis porri]KAF7900546.1 hypothetical protein EAF01_007848 [Botrytis porri]
MGVSELVDSINLATSRSSELNDEDRVKLLSACEKLQSSLEGPRDKLMKMIFCKHLVLQSTWRFSTAAALSAAGKEIRAEDLALPKDANPLLIGKSLLEDNKDRKEMTIPSAIIMRLLVGMGYFTEIARQIYKPTPLASALVTTTQNEVVAALLTYFAQKGYQSPNDAYDGPFQFARQTDLRCFDWMATQPRIQHAFNTVMTIPRTTGRAAWYEYFPVAEKLKVETPSDRLIVDIGGGIGHDSVRFKEVHPKLQGKLIIEDIPVVVSSVAQGSLPDGIEAQSYDFFKPQPICNAKAYFLADVLHDWPDTQASVILEQFKDAIGKESVLLINENLMQEENASFESAYTD